ncbi:serine/threonine-protein kinase Nek5-like [Ylistrum balloti]|uniref:serine/threonine-protein kinase Nek5-like n=1 Tax=Ylistrum balloti TaxID=509963 RepID=UPI002905E068|nr:serine/threonine-protein kinase Nek5-like [Ylistrum balloti]
MDIIKFGGLSISNVVANKSLHLYDNYDLIMPHFVNQRHIDYNIGEENGLPVHVGHGSFGDVFRIRFTDGRCSDTKICIKEFTEKHGSKTEAIEEARKLLYLSDTGYVPVCFGLVEFTNQARNQDSFGIIQEFIGEGQTLHRFLRQSKNKISKADWISIAFQLARGLDKFHDKRILVNDIKANNIVMYTRKQGQRLKYIDFGLASYRSGRAFHPPSEKLARLRHLAPEVRKGFRTNETTDVYSLGCLLRQINVYGNIKDLLLISHMCTRDAPKMRLSAHATRLLIENIVDE